MSQLLTAVPRRRPGFALGLALCAVVLLAQSLWAATYSNAYLSSRNRERNVRAQTRFIILHTTEAEAKSALRKLSDNGEVHYCIDRDGTIYRIINRQRVAFHCGRSMWNGLTNIDAYSIGIEIIGYHDKDISAAQYRATRELLATLKQLYNISDANVMTHSQVAYGAPNRWHKKSHRGRKRCGMAFATKEVRAKLGLTSRYLVDPDVKAKRLIVADTFLSQVLYAANGAQLLPFKVKPAVATQPAKQNVVAAPDTPEPRQQNATREDRITATRSAWDIAREAYKAATTIYIFPNGTRKNGLQITNWGKVPIGTKVIVTDPDNPGLAAQIVTANASAKELAGDEALAETTYYVLPTGFYRRGSTLTPAELARLPQKTRVLTGYQLGGPVKTNLLPSQICPNQWNAPGTFYFIKGVLYPRENVDMAKVPVGTLIFYRE